MAAANAAKQTTTQQRRTVRAGTMALWSLSLSLFLSPLWRGVLHKCGKMLLDFLNGGLETHTHTMHVALAVWMKAVHCSMRRRRRGGEGDECRDSLCCARFSNAPPDFLKTEREREKINTTE